MSRNSSRPFLPCGSYHSKSTAKNAILDITDDDQKWEVGPTHTIQDKDGNTQTRYSIQRTK